MPKETVEPFSRHEVQHMAEFFCRAVDSELCKHRLVASRPDLLALAQKASDALGELYQAAGNI